jgi:DNA-directed RNA polymerase specialized sigma24 family protein
MAAAGTAKEVSPLVRRRTMSAAPGSSATAIAAVYEREFRAFVGGVYVVVGDVEVARDVVQEAFARALRDRRRFRGEETLEAWLWRVVINVARDVAPARGSPPSRPTSWPS